MNWRGELRTLGIVAYCVAVVALAIRTGVL